jgi:hypothetical protein
MLDHPVEQVRSTLQVFQDHYTARDPARLDTCMELFVPDERIELIGVGASKRAAHEWFEGPGQIREIIEGDWKYWGDVRLDVAGARITACGEVAWLSTTGTLTQTEAFDAAIQFHLDDMKAIFDRPDLSADEKLLEVTHYGMRRLRERLKGRGCIWPFTFTAVLQRVGDGWRFHTIHWSMPVD